MQQRLNSLSCDKSIFNTAALRWVQCKEGSYVTMWMSSSRLSCLSSFVFNTSAMSYSLLERRFKGWNEWTMTRFIEKLSDRELVQYFLFLGHWNKKLCYFSCSWICVQFLAHDKYLPPHHHVHFTVNVASLDFSETTEGIFLLPLLWWRAT